jgi:iron complex transport system substrate-binding protein
VRAAPLIAVALAAALPGCQESGFDESRETQRPLKVQHAMDPLQGTRVPGVAERPMTLTVDSLGDALALGVKPVRAALPRGRAPEYLRAAARGVEVVPPLTGLDIAATEAVEPDVILGAKESDEEFYDELKRIAPTIMTEGHNWKLNLRLHGEALGRTNDAERLLIDWDNRVARVRTAIGDRKIAVPPGAGKSVFAEQVLADLGVDVHRDTVETVRVKPGFEWTSGGILAARAILDEISGSL